MTIEIELETFLKGLSDEQIKDYFMVVEPPTPEAARREIFNAIFRATAAMVSARYETPAAAARIEVTPKGLDMAIMAVTAALKADPTVCERTNWDNWLELLRNSPRVVKDQVADGAKWRLLVNDATEHIVPGTPISAAWSTLVRECWTNIQGRYAEMVPDSVVKLN